MRTKYKAMKAVYRGESYDSGQEAAYAAQVIDQEIASGRVLFALRQPRFVLGHVANVYRADWLVVCPWGVYALDVKGHEPPAFRRVRKLWPDFGPCPLVVAKLDCRYPKRAPGEERDPEHLPTIRSFERDVIPGGLDRRDYRESPGIPDWLLVSLHPELFTAS